MSKSVYSLVLSDEVVQEIDRLAYRNNTNRSNMINQILAEQVSLTTPEKRMHEIFERMEALLLDDDNGRHAFQMQSLPTDTLFSLRSAIQYKYNPSVRYNVELYRQIEDGVIGELRVSLRTQNKTLLAALDTFYRIWGGLEQRYFDDLQRSYSNGKYTRRLKLHFRRHPQTDLSGLTVGDVISSYINTFDKALKTFFSSDAENPSEEISKIYQNYLEGEVFV